MQIKTINVKTAKGKIAKVNIERSYDMDSGELVGYRVIVLVTVAKSTWERFTIRKDIAGGYYVLDETGDAISHEDTLRAARRKCATRAIDNNPTILVDETTNSFNREFGRAINNGNAFGDIHHQIRPKKITAIAH